MDREVSPLVAGLREGLRQQHEQHLYRQPRVLDGSGGTEALWDGRRVLLFCSNDYLGLANHPLVVEAMRDAAGRYGVGAGAAHLVTGHRHAHQALEEELAAFTGRRRALLFSTGYMANLGVLGALSGRGGRVYQDRYNHASLLDGSQCVGARLQRYPHRDMATLEQRLQAYRGDTPALVASDTVFSMDGDRAPLASLAALSSRYRAWLLVDDAHGFGVLGPQGRGTLAEQGLDSVQVPVLMATLGKAVGTFGAFVAGDEELIETLVQRARSYIYTTAAPPAVAAATRAALRLIEDGEGLRQRLATLVTRFRDGAGQLGLTPTGVPAEPSGADRGNPATPIQPLLLGSSRRALRASGELLDAGFVVTAIRPPTVPEGSARLRVTLSAAHTEEQVDRLLNALDRVLRKRDE